MSTAKKAECAGGSQPTAAFRYYRYKIYNFDPKYVNAVGEALPADAKEMSTRITYKRYATAMAHFFQNVLGLDQWSAETRGFNELFCRELPEATVLPPGFESIGVAAYSHHIPVAEMTKKGKELFAEGLEHDAQVLIHFKLMEKSWKPAELEVRESHGVPAAKRSRQGPFSFSDTIETMQKKYAIRADRVVFVVHECRKKIQLLDGASVTNDFFGGLAAWEMPRKIDGTPALEDNDSEEHALTAVVGTLRAAYVLNPAVFQHFAALIASIAADEKAELYKSVSREETDAVFKEYKRSLQRGPRDINTWRELMRTGRQKHSDLTGNLLLDLVDDLKGLFTRRPADSNAGKRDKHDK